MTAAPAGPAAERLEQDEFASLTLIRYHQTGRLRFAGAHEDLVVYRAASGRCEFVPTAGHAAAVGAGARRLRVDLRRLEFMSSSCFKSLVSWMVKLEALPTDSRYRLCFVSDPHVLWQRRGLSSLASLVEGLVTVESGSPEDGAG